MERFIHDSTNGLDYELVGDYYLPLLTPPKTPQIGRFGEAHRKYLRTQKKALYSGLILSDELNTYLEAIDRRANEMFYQLIKNLAEKEGVTEELKAADQMEWLGRMNNILNRAIEIVNAEVIYA